MLSACIGVGLDFGPRISARHLTNPGIRGGDVNLLGSISLIVDNASGLLLEDAIVAGAGG